MYFWPPTNTKPKPKISTKRNRNEDTTAKNEGGAREMRFCSPAKVNTNPPSSTQNTNHRVKLEGYIINATIKAAREANMPKMPLVTVQSSSSEAPELNRVPQKIVWFKEGVWYLV